MPPKPTYLDPHLWGRKYHALGFSGSWRTLLFISNEGSPREPVHIHVEKGECEAKFWLRQDVTLAESFGFNRRELTELARLVESRRNEIERAWHEYFG